MTTSLQNHLLYRGVTTSVLLLGANALAQTPPAPETLPAPAEAASAPSASASSPAGSAAKLESVTVTGIRRANNAAINAKRDATNIVDAIGSSEVRALPDATVVESLRRIPGLSITPVNDNEHPRDEAITPVIRGLGPAYTNVTVDGLPIASPGTPNGVLGSIQRGVRLDILPSSMISELQVFKSYTPDLDPNAIGGAINILTRSAFEGGGAPFLTMEGALGHATDVSKPRSQSDPGQRFSMTGSRTFGPDKTYGVTFAANYQALSSYTVEHATSDVQFYNFYNNAGQLQTGTGLGNGFAVPQEDRYWYAQNDRKRYGATLKLEARPSNDLETSLSGGYYYFKDRYQRNEDYIAARPDWATVNNQTPTTGSYSKGLEQVGFIDDSTISKTKFLQTGFKWRPDERQLLSFNGGWSRATYDEVYPMIKYATGVVLPAPGTGGSSQITLPQYGFTYDTSNFQQSFNLPPAARNDLSQYTLLYYRPFIHRQADDKILTGRLDYGFNRGSDDRGLGFAAGVSYTTDRPGYSIGRLEYVPNTSAPALSLAGVVGPTAPLPYAQDGRGLLTIDPNAFQTQFQSLPGSALNQTNQTAFNNQDNFTHQEKTFGAYSSVGIQTDEMSAEAGLHLDSTKQSTVGRLLVNGAFQDMPTSSSYAYVLPSGIVKWHATPALDVRAAASQTIGRPSYDSYAARSSVAFVNPSDQGNPNATGVSVTVGNPDLKPRRSTNLDLSLDWLTSKQYGGLVSVAAFYKKIKDEIFNAATQGYTYQGVTYANAVVTRPVNSSGASIGGLELNGTVNSLAFIDPILNGFGASTNVALLRGRLDVPLSAGGTRTVGNLVNQPDYTFNASAFYVKDGLETRLAFNRQGRALRAVFNDVAWQDLYWAPRNQLDLSATYAFEKGWSIFAQASNITKTRVTSVTGPDKNLLRDEYTVPTTFWIGLRYTPDLR